ncbi:uncharacterized [Tachysurus ichikawai]
MWVYTACCWIAVSFYTSPSLTRSLLAFIFSLARRVTSLSGSFLSFQFSSTLLHPNPPLFSFPTPSPILSPSLPSSTSNMMGGELPGAESGRESYSISETLCSPARQPLAKLKKAGKNGAQWGGAGLGGVQNSCLVSGRSV